MSKSSSYLAFPFQDAGSPLLRLPLELREMIYRCVLGGKTWLINAGPAKPCADNSVEHALALLRVNRQIYAEASLIPYRCSTFEGRHSGHLKEFIRKLAPIQREAVASIKRHQHSYILQSAEGLEVSPIFWMEIPNMGGWGMSGLKQIEVEVILRRWSWDLDERKVLEARGRAVEKLRTLIENQHPGVRLAIT